MVEGDEHRRRGGAGQDAAHHLGEEGIVTPEGGEAEGVVDVAAAEAISRGSDAPDPLAFADVGGGVDRHAYAFRSRILCCRSMSSPILRAL